jgi:Geminivirus Rep catalytic domain
LAILIKIKGIMNMKQIENNKSLKAIDVGDVLQKDLVKSSHKKPIKKDFLLSAKNLYLTYSNCNLDLDETLKQLKIILSSYIVLDYLLVREYHKTDQPHIHVYLKTSKKCNITSSIFLDLKNTEGKIFHGNYQSAKKKNSVIEYMLKNIPKKSDSNILYSENMSKLIGELANYKTLEEALIDLAEEGKIEEAMLLLKKEDPSKYLSQGSKYEKRMIEIYKDQYLLKQRQYNLENFHISKEMFDSLKEYIHRRKQGENPVLAIVGEARHR